MPRIKALKKSYMLSDLTKYIFTRMKELKITQKEMASLLGIEQGTFSNRLKKGQFSYSELVTILHKLRATDQEILKLMKL